MAVSTSAQMCCPDPNRSANGAWLLSGDLEPRVEDLKRQHPSLTEAQCFQHFGAEWMEGYYNRSEDGPLHFLYKDPQRTRRTRINDGVEFRGAWSMTEAQKAEADGLKNEHPELEWSQCFETAGGVWDSSYYSCILDVDGVAEAEIWAHIW